MGTYIEKNKKTKQLIQTTFLSLLEEKTFESITIGDITKQAMINRGTFYLHYMDKYDLLDKIEQQLFADLGSYIVQLQSSYVTSSTFSKEQELLAQSLFRFIAQNEPTLKIFLGSHGRAGFHLRFRDAFTKIVRNSIETNEEICRYLTAPVDYFLAFSTSAFLGLIEQWVQNGLDKTPEEMTDMYINIIMFIKKTN